MTREDKHFWLIVLASLGFVCFIALCVELSDRDIEKHARLRCEKWGRLQNIKTVRDPDFGCLVVRPDGTHERINIQ